MNHSWAESFLVQIARWMSIPIITIYSTKLSTILTYYHNGAHNIMYNFNLVASQNCYVAIYIQFLWSECLYVHSQWLDILMPPGMIVPMGAYYFYCVCLYMDVCPQFG